MSVEPTPTIEITLARALTYLKRIKERISEVENAIVLTNSVPVENSENREVDPVKQLEFRGLLVEQLLDVKVKISKANQPIYPKILAIAEKKGKLGFLRRIDTKDGYVPPSYHGDVPVTYSAAIRKSRIEDMILEANKWIDATQAEIDAFNHTTKITVQDIGLI